MILISFGYNDTISVPREVLPYLDQFIPVTEVSGTYQRANRTISVVVTDKELVTGDSALEARLKAAEADAAMKYKWYTDEKAKVAKLEAGSKETV